MCWMGVHWTGMCRCKSVEWGVCIPRTAHCVFSTVHHPAELASSHTLCGVRTLQFMFLWKLTHLYKTVCAPSHKADQRRKHQHVRTLLVTSSMYRRLSRRLTQPWPLVHHEHMAACPAGIGHRSPATHVAANAHRVGLSIRKK